MKPLPGRFGRLRSLPAFASACLFLVAAVSAPADNLDDFVAAQMRSHHLVGLSLAVINEGKTVKARGCGFTDKSGKMPITASTLFQAGSVSKPIAALAAVRLVEQGRLSLDADVNDQWRTWKV